MARPQPQTQTQQPDSEQIVKDAAALIKGGTDLDMDALFMAAGHAVKLGVDENDPDFLRLVILMQAGDYAAAGAMLVEMAMSSGGNQATPQSSHPLASIFNAPAATQPAQPDPSASTAPTVQQPAVDPATTGKSGSSRRPRNR